MQREGGGTDSSRQNQELSLEFKFGIDVCL